LAHYHFGQSRNLLIDLIFLLFVGGNLSMTILMVERKRAKNLSIRQIYCM